MGCEFSKLYNLEIHLENDLGIYEPLDVVAGHVLIQVENDTSIHHCFLTLRGLAYFSSPNSDNKQNSNAENIEEFQILLTQTEDLLKEYKINDNGYNPEEKDDTNFTPEFIITKGLHIFNFEFQLPSELPASFVVPSVLEADNLHAFVIYNIKVEVVNVLHQVSHSRERDIIVFRSLDLNQYPRLKDKVTLKKEFVISECFTSKSKLLCELTVNKCAFVPGEILIVDVLIKNGSSKPIESVQLSLLQNVSVKSPKAEKLIHLKLFSIGMGSVSPHRAHNFSDNIHIPPVAASGLAGCEIIDINYSLIAQLYVFGDKSRLKDLSLKIPITIGSDPIKDASFGENKEVVPCYALFDYDSGAVIEYVPLKVTSSVHHMMPVYRYYKPAPKKLLYRCPNRSIPCISRNVELKSTENSHQSIQRILNTTSPPFSRRSSSSGSDSYQISSPNFIEMQNSFDKYSVFDNKSSNALCINLQNSINLQIMTNRRSDFSYYLSEESSDITESIW